MTLPSLKSMQSVILCHPSAKYCNRHVYLLTYLKNHKSQISPKNSIRVTQITQS